MHSHSVENWLEQVEITRKPVARGSEHPHTVFAAPAGFAVNLPQLTLLAGDQRSDHDGALSCVSNKLVDVAFANGRFVFVVHENAWLHWSAVRSAIRQDEVAILGEFLADRNAS